MLTMVVDSDLGGLKRLSSSLRKSPGAIKTSASHTINQVGASARRDIARHAMMKTGLSESDTLRRQVYFFPSRETTLEASLLVLDKPSDDWRRQYDPDPLLVASVDQMVSRIEAELESGFVGRLLRFIETH